MNKRAEFRHFDLDGLGRLMLLAAVCQAVTGIAVAESPAVVAGDAPVTVFQTMQNDASLADLYFIDRENGWAVGDRGVIWHTTSGGRTWQLQASGVTCQLASVCFLDTRRGWAAGGTTQPYSHASRGVLIATQDGGASWSELPQSTLPAITRLKFFDAERGIAAGDASPLFPSGVFVTRDGGRTWQPLPADAGGQWLAADFPDGETGAVAGRAGRFATLMRRRVVHDPTAMSNSRAFRALRLAPPTDGWLVGDGGLVMMTHDLGNSWQTPPSDLPQFIAEAFDFNAVAVAAAGQHVWIAGSPGSRVFHSADQGQSWQSFATGNNAPLHAITFIDADTGYVAGDLGIILATNDGGRTWNVQRQGGKRAALLAVFARETDVPLELVAKLGAEEGYLTAVKLLQPSAETRIHEAMLLAGATAANLTWQFPPAPDDSALTPAELHAALNRANDGRAAERLQGQIVGQLRMWRPDVVVTHASDPMPTNPFASLVEQLVLHCVEAAADPNQYQDLASVAGLDPWQVKKVYGLMPSGSRSDVRIATGQFAPRLGATLADWAEPPRRLIYAKHFAPPDTIELQKLNRDANGKADANNLFSGIVLAPGGEARRRAANVASDDLEKLRRLAMRRRQMQALVAQTQGNAAWAGQVANLTDGLDAASGGELLFQLADGYRATGRLDLAADTYSTLARHWPEHPLVEPSLRWLVQFYASSEIAGRLGRGTEISRDSEVRQASTDAAPVVGLSRDDRLRRAAAIGQYLESARPALFAEPSVRFPLVVAQRQLGYSNPAQRYFLTLHSLPDDDPWRRCGETEEWFAKPAGSPPPKTLGSCRRAAGRPHLDGQLDELFWHTADRLRLSGKSTTEAEVCFTYDSQFLYLAIRCPKAAGVDYSNDDRPRPRDADLARLDRVTLRLDLDRDYTTAFELAVDHRGWTRDACWGDASWNPNWFVAAAADESAWTIEAAIPLAELAAEPPTTREVWAVAVRRTIPRVGSETWSGDATSDDSPDHFGLLIFE